MLIIKEIRFGARHGGAPLDPSGREAEVGDVSLEQVWAVQYLQVHPGLHRKILYQTNI